MSEIPAKTSIHWGKALADSNKGCFFFFFHKADADADADVGAEVAFEVEVKVDKRITYQMTGNKPS